MKFVNHEIYFRGVHNSNKPLVSSKLSCYFGENGVPQMKLVPTGPQIPASEGFMCHSAGGKTLNCISKYVSFGNS